MLTFIDLKRENATVDYALALVEIAIENNKSYGQSIIKVLHGYGSHGRGGAIIVQLRRRLRSLKKSGKIRDYFSGDQWNVFNDKTFELLQQDKSLLEDEDLNKNNPGITIIVV